MRKMAPSTAKAKNHVDEENRLTRGLTKLSTAFTTDLQNFQELRSKCTKAVEGITSNTAYKTHQNVLCDYITSAVRGTYGNSRRKGQGSSEVWSGLDRKNRCYMLRICMKYLMYHYCISEDDVKTVLNAMESQVKTWNVGGDGSPEEKEKNRGAFGRCISKSLVKSPKGGNDLKCKVIKIIKDSDRGKPEQLEKIKPSGGGSGTCPMNYDNGCNNGNAVTGVPAVDVDSEESEDDDEDDEDDDVDTITTTTTTTTSSIQTPSLPGANGKKGNLPFPSLSSFPFDSIHPYLPLVPPVLGIMTITYFLWKYFGQLGKIRRFRRAPSRIPGPSVQEQLLDHVQKDSSHEYRLVKERKPRSVPTREKRSGRVNRRTIIEIHFEVLDECQKGDSQLAQKDFLELLVREFMGSELREEEQVLKEEVLMESVPILGSWLLV
ncbi:SICAvar, type II [Plasmodium knowlesi strain H]|uniref:SICAvar, type II n=4 Tax=Plasmodium knowlesi TaxID=5850 RepID=A0A679L5W0_PLAKH|nr:SICAvar, type II [Plasmodium knowlesi strain H]OTN64376.1 SICAvar type II [Plasmodium knowlesi]CAA9989273.1 SICAvar, type II [Plasmodium knowlesi strain H]SBO26874.1 SICAvar, type II [Plasmodium knowlesi strain H]VVS78747.1 SICAvar, type II [Plasmodium knowlesi strain H]